MNILLINVSLRPNSTVKLFPVGLGYIATAMKNAGYTFDVLDIDAHRYSDAEIEAIIGRKRYDVFCMGCIVTGYKIIKELSAVIRRHHRDAIIVVGNSVATSIPDTLLIKTDVDVAVMGEGDITIVDLLRTIYSSGPLEEVRGICFVRDGRMVMTPPRPYIRDISTIPLLDFSIFDIEIYIENSRNSVSDPLPIPRESVRALPVNTARGCIASCGFCYHNFKGIPYRYRTSESIVEEIRHSVNTYNLNYIHFWDELTFFSKKQVQDFLQKVKVAGLHFYWTATCRGNLFTDDDDVEIIKEMKGAGCLAMNYSLESADPVILEAMNKRMSVEDFSRQTRLFHRAELPVGTSIVLGYPQETPETIRRTFDCCIENRIYPSAGYLLPQPGSQMYEYAVGNGFIVDEEEYLLIMGDRQDLRLNMTRMSDDEFEANVLEGLNRCNKALNIGLKEASLIKTQYYRSSKK